jgi:ribonuclease VapC
MTEPDSAAAVLDASAILAFVREERGASRVETAIRNGALISTLNWAEMLSALAEDGEAVEISVPRVKARIARIGILVVVTFDEAQGEQAARLRMSTKPLGLSLADRACLALGRIHHLPVLTTDRVWRSLHLSVKIEVIR